MLLQCIAARGHTKGHPIARRARLSVSGHRPVAVRSVVSIVRDTSMTLPDGRVLAYTDLGARSGRLVIHSDGAPSSRLELVLFDEIFSELDVRWCARTVPATGARLPSPVVEWQAGRRTSRRWRTICAASDSPSPVPRVVGPMRWLVPRCSQTGSQQWVCRAQGLACYAALLTLAYFMWRRPSVASHVPNAAPQPSADWRHQRASDPNRA